jgi:hypothetical protein
MFASYFLIVFVAQVLRQRHVRIVRACAGTFRQPRQCSLLFEMPQQRQRPALLSAAQPIFISLVVLCEAQCKLDEARPLYWPLVVEIKAAGANLMKGGAGGAGADSIF